MGAAGSQGLVAWESLVSGWHCFIILIIVTRDSWCRMTREFLNINWIDCQFMSFVHNLLLFDFQ